NILRIYPVIIFFAYFMFCFYFVIFDMKLREQITVSTNKVEVYNVFLKCCRYHYDFMATKKRRLSLFLHQNLERLNPYMKINIKYFGDYVINLQKIP
ncbi:hypothetical protein QAC07_32185, partial [Bacillus thuringiensis]